MLRSRFVAVASKTLGLSPLRAMPWAGRVGFLMTAYGQMTGTSPHIMGCQAAYFHDPQIHTLKYHYFSLKTLKMTQHALMTCFPRTPNQPPSFPFPGCRYVRSCHFPFDSLSCVKINLRGWQVQKTCFARAMAAVLICRHLRVLRVDGTAWKEGLFLQSLVYIWWFIGTATSFGKDPDVGVESLPSDNLSVYCQLLMWAR